MNRNLLIPNNVDHINDGIFHESNIDTLTISSSVKKIGYLAFSESTVKRVKFSTGLDSIASYAFYNTRLDDIVLPNGLKFIGEYAFYGCKDAQHIQINNEISEIEQNAFRGCSSVQKLVLGNGIKKIKSNAFADCGQLQSVVSKSLTPPDIEANAFSAGAYLFATLYVPTGTKSLYEAATGWKDFVSIKEGIGPNGDEETPEKEKCATPTIAIKDGKLSFSCETEDVTFCYSVTPPSSLQGEGDEVSLSNKYTISVYAKKEGYENSETVTKEIEVGGGTKGDMNEDGVLSVTDVGILITTILQGE